MTMHNRNLMKIEDFINVYSLSLDESISSYLSNLSDLEPCYAGLCSLSQPCDIQELLLTSLAHDSLANKKRKHYYFGELSCNCHKQ